MRLEWADGLTFLNLAAGLSALVLAAQWTPRTAGLLLLAAVLFDLFDGRVARWTGKVRPFGMYLDSLADIVSFGIVPYAIAVLWVPSWWTVLLGGAFVLAGAYRLARFQAVPVKDGYMGMPITVNGVATGLLFLFLSAQALMWVLPVYFAFASVLMVSTIRVGKL